MSSPSWSEWSSSAMGSFVTSAHAFLHACSSCARPSHRRVCVRVCACVCVCVCVCACPAPWAASSPPPTRSCTPAAPAPVRVTAVCVCACVCVQRHGQLRHLRPRLLARLQLLRPSESGSLSTHALLRGDPSAMMARHRPRKLTPGKWWYSAPILVRLSLSPHALLGSDQGDERPTTRPLTPARRRGGIRPPPHPLTPHASGHRPQCVCVCVCARARARARGWLSPHACEFSASPQACEAPRWCSAHSASPRVGRRPQWPRTGTDSFASLHGLVRVHGHVCVPELHELPSRSLRVGVPELPSRSLSTLPAWQRPGRRVPDEGVLRVPSRLGGVAVVFGPLRVPSRRA
jgi:hypothetical protein